MEIIPDCVIEELLLEGKPLPTNYITRLKTRLKKKMKFEGRELEILGDQGELFEIRLRKSTIDPMDFSVILRYYHEPEQKWKILSRYNGKSHPHSNPLERERSFRDYHIHKATERYQESGYRIEHYAERTTKYNSFEEAIFEFLKDYNFYDEVTGKAKYLDDFGNLYPEKGGP